MSRIIRDVQQRTPDWDLLRMGKVTSSNAHRIITPKERRYSASAKKYMAEIIAERITGEPHSSGPMTRDMMHGVEFEPMARSNFAFDLDAEIEQVGGIVSDCGRWFASTDGIIDNAREVCELKCPNLETHILYMLRPELLLEEYACQCHFYLLFPEVERVRLRSFAPELPPVDHVVIRDDFTEALQLACEKFDEELRVAMARIEKIREA